MPERMAGAGEEPVSKGRAAPPVSRQARRWSSRGRAPGGALHELGTDRCLAPCLRSRRPLVDGRFGALAGGGIVLRDHGVLGIHHEVAVLAVASQDGPEYRRT